MSQSLNSQTTHSATPLNTDAKQRATNLHPYRTTTQHYPATIQQTATNSASTISTPISEDIEDKLSLNSDLTSSNLEDEVAIASLAQTILPPKGLENYLQEQERNLIITALKQTGWNKTQAAELLGTTFRSLRYRMKKLEIEEDE